MRSGTYVNVIGHFVLFTMSFSICRCQCSNSPYSFDNRLFDDIALTSRFDNTAAESNIRTWKLTQYGICIILACLVPCPWGLFYIFKARKSKPTCSPKLQP